MWSFAWQNLVTRPTRTSLAVLGLTIPVLAFLGLFSVSAGIRHLMGDTLGRMQNLIILRANALVPVLSDLPAGMAETLRQVPGVRTVAPEVWKVAPAIDGRGGGGVGTLALGMLTRSRAQGLGDFTNMVAVEGIDIAEHRKLRTMTMAESILPRSKGGGRFLEPADVGQPHLVMSAKIARAHPNADGSPKKAGQTIKLGTTDFTVVGIYETGSIILDGTLVMDINMARLLLNLSPDATSTFNVEPLHIAETDAVADRIEHALPEVRAQRISQFNLTVGAVMGKLDLFLLLAVALAMLVGGVGIANTMLMSTSERYVEFGVMRTNGWTRRNVLALVTAESALLGVLSGCLGASLATGAVLALNRVLDGFTLDLNPWLVVVSVAGSCAIATLSGLYPAWKASRMTPMDAIRNSVTA